MRGSKYETLSLQDVTTRKQFLGVVVARIFGTAYIRYVNKKEDCFSVQYSGSWLNDVSYTKRYKEEVKCLFNALLNDECKNIVIRGKKESSKQYKKKQLIL